jgi:NitT/TauT family transport system substrate-binding protein
MVRRASRAVSVVALVSAALTACGGNDGTTSDGLTKVTVSYSEKVADYLPLWTAVEKGYFKKQGLDVRLVNLASDKGFPALISGQVDIAAIGGTQIVSGKAAGADVKILGAATPVLPFQLYADVASGSQLKGKKVGYTSKSGSQYVGTVQAIQAAGLKPSDVDLVPLGDVSNVNSALLAGRIDAAASHPPATSKFESAGLHDVVDLAKEATPYINVSYAAMTPYIKDHGDVLDKFFAAIKQGTDLVRSDKAAATKILGQYIGEDDQAALDDAWTFYTSEVIKPAPVADASQLKLSVESLKGSVDGVEDVDLDSLIDSRFVDKAFGVK